MAVHLLTNPDRIEDCVASLLEGDVLVWLATLDLTPLPLVADIDVVRLATPNASEVTTAAPTAVATIDSLKLAELIAMRGPAITWGA